MPSRGETNSSPITRRGFLVGAGTGLAAGASLTWLGMQAWKQGYLSGDNQPLADTRGLSRGTDAMPGPFPGRVVEIQCPDAVALNDEVNPAAVKVMMDRGMTELTGADHPQEAWKRFFEPDDIVGIKVNPVGMKRPGYVGAISSPAVLIETVEGLKSAGIKPRNIIVFERYAKEFRDAGYEAIMSARPMDGVRWYASAAGYDNGQLDIEGYDSRPGRTPSRDPHVVGYDPDVFVHMGFAQPDAEFAKDQRRFRSHLSIIVTSMVNKIVTIPVLKDHRSAGVTLALKNLSHGMNNNVARSHLGSIYRLGDQRSAPNQCNTFIPTAAGQSPLRQKATLHILDGLIGVYEGGPGSWNTTWGTWRRNSLFFATDPVALDHVGWNIIDQKRAERGWLPVAMMGQLQLAPSETVSSQLAKLAAGNGLAAATLAGASAKTPTLQNLEQFDRRQPEHIILAATIGLGVFDRDKIEHRVVRV
jgi:uncharacterized protein (DUF362 family)